MDIAGQRTPVIAGRDGLDDGPGEKTAFEDPANREGETQTRNRRYKDQTDCFEAVGKVSTLNHIFTIK